MPEKQIQMLVEWRDNLAHALMFLVIGISIGLGQLLASPERLTKRIIIGRALSTGGLSMAAGLVLVWVPDLPLVGQIGAAAGLASLGTSGLERMFQRVLQGMVA